MSHIRKSDFKARPPRAAAERMRKRALISQPNKSMKVSEIVRRYSIGLDIGVPMAQTSDHPEQEVDLERMSRMDRVDKAYKADELRRENEQIKARADEELRRRKEEADEAKRERIKARKDAANKATEAPKGPVAGTGIGSA